MKRSSILILLSGMLALFTLCSSTGCNEGVPDNKTAIQEQAHTEMNQWDYREGRWVRKTYKKDTESK